mgnify:CR=1 FL=1
MKKNFLITTGGSGGHVIPAMILYQHLSKETNVIISTDKRGLRYLDKDNLPVEVINTPKLNNFVMLPINLFIILFLIIKSYFLLKQKKIEKIFSTGGYMSLPLILAAKFLRIDIYLIEPNQVLGRSNRFFLKFCKKIFCYSDEIKNFPNIHKDKIIKINPLVREKTYNVEKNFENKKKFNILVIGGSQGASFFDKDLKNSIINISKKKTIRIIHQTSEKNISSLKDFYSDNNIENIIFSYKKNLVDIIKEADLCITRAGASTLAELSVLNIPFIAVPLPTSKDNHQLENANYYKKKDCCWIIEQSSFKEEIEETLNDIIEEKKDYLKKKNNLKKLNYQNTWINVNQKILKSLNEN